jgi:hypothetical protein
MTNTVTKITILSTAVDNSYIRSLQTLTINFQMSTTGVFTGGKDIYV